MACIFDGRWRGENGIGRFTVEVMERLKIIEYSGSGAPMSPLDPIRISKQLMEKNAKEKNWFFSPGYNAPVIGNLPYILTLHDLNHIDRTENSSQAKRLYYRFVLRYLCRRARAIFTVSEFSRKRIVAWSGIDDLRVFNVGNGVSSVFSPKGRKWNMVGSYVLCVSNRRGHKNEMGMLRSFARAHFGSNTKLVMTGNPISALTELANELGIASSLIFTGKLAEVDLADLYRGALFLVFPSFYEGFGLPIVEAFACGTPVITSNVTSMPEIAGDAALLVDPYDIDDMADAMVRLHESSALRAQLIERGFTRVSQFTWDAVVERIKLAVQTVDTDPAYPLSWS